MQDSHAHVTEWGCKLAETLNKQQTNQHDLMDCCGKGLNPCMRSFWCSSCLLRVHSSLLRNSHMPIDNSVTLLECEESVVAYGG